MRHPLSLLLILAAISVCLLFPTRNSRAQFASPSVDGVIGAGEYGTHTDGQNQQSTGTGQTWYMTWDDTNLYVGITNANLSEAAVIYIDRDPISPVNGGSNSNGNLTGFNNYDNTSFSGLPFRADFVTYFKSGYREYRTADGSGGWSGPTSFAGSFATGAGNVREISIPWSAVTGAGRPASFLFFGYLTSAGGFVYGQVPQANAGGFIGTSASYSHYYTVTSTANGSSTKPFSIDSSAGSNNINFLGLRHDTFDGYYRNPFGAVSAGTNVTLRFRTDHFDVDGVSLRVYTYNPATDSTSGPVDYAMSFLENRTENGTLYDIWTYTLAAPATPSVLYYKFRITDGVDVAYYSDSYLDDHDNLGQGGEGAASDSEPFPAFQITVYDPAFQTPQWMQDANVYQIFPDRFRNGDADNDYCAPNSTAGCPVFYGGDQVVRHTTWNESIYDPRAPGPYQGTYSTQFFGGDLKGIQNKLDYLQSLGVDTIYMTPIFKARSNHRYDTDDYFQVDPALGGDAALASLKTETERRGMHLIFDGVFNHSSSDSVYFDRYHRYGPPNGACEDTGSPYRSWYNFFNNNTPCTGADYEGWFGFDSLAVFVDNSPALRDFIYRGGTDNVVKHWYDRGASGWRFDVADNISHNWWHEFRPFAKGYKSDGPLIGEIWPDASQFLAGDQLDSVMNYRFRKNVLGFARGGASWNDDDNFGNNTLVALAPSQFDHALRAVREDYPQQATNAMMDLIDSHDTNRALYVLTEAGDSGLTQAKERLKLTALFQFTYMGAPTVYYGDEAAINAPSLANGPNGPEDDPYNRAPYPWSDESGDPAVYGPADSSVINFYTKLAHLRKQHAALRTGNFDALLTGDTTASSTDDNTYAFARTGGGETAIVALNSGGASNSASIPVSSYFTDGTQLQDALSGATYNVSGGQVSVTLSARSGVALFQSPASVDTTSPTASISSSLGNDCSNTSVTLTGTDEAGGSGVKELRYWIAGGAVNVVQGSSANISVNSCTPVLVSLRVVDNAGNISSEQDAVVPSPTAADSSITGRVVDGSGRPVGGVVLNLSGWTERQTITNADGRFAFNNLETNGFYVVTPALAGYEFAPAIRTYALTGNRADATFTASREATAAENPLDTDLYFVRQQYLDFLGREPDEGGLRFWASKLSDCHGDADCLRRARVEISAAFFQSEEFQQTGSFIYRLYRASFGARPSYRQFLQDRALVTAGAELESRKTAFINAWVNGSSFKQAYPDSLSAGEFVGRLMNAAGYSAASGDAYLSMLKNGATRAEVLSTLIESRSFRDREYNSSFVLMQYFGYLRRDADEGGFQFWLDVLNNCVPGDYRSMVCAFLTSTEYQHRFSAVVTHSNSECGR